MRATYRLQPVAVIDEFFADPHGFEFFQAVRLLERWFYRGQGVGRAELMARRLSFRNSLSMSFPPNEIERVNAVLSDEATATPFDLDQPLRVPPSARERRPSIGQIERLEITPAFMSLLGANGALPIFYTELFVRREQSLREDSSRAFLDIFLHRAVVLFYQAWCKHRLAIRYETDRRNEFLPQVLAVAGIGQKSLTDRLGASSGGLSDEIIAFFGGLVQQRTVSAAALQQVLSAYFRVPVQVTQFVGRWFTLSHEHQTRLGLRNASLNASALTGERVWQRDMRVGLTFGPLSLERYRRFLPGGKAARALNEMVSLLTGVSLEYEVRLRLRAADVHPIRLGDPQGGRLGWETFLITQPGGHDRADVGYDLHAAG